MQTLFAVVTETAAPCKEEPAFVLSCKARCAIGL